MMQHVAIYARVSTPKQNTRSQETDLKRWIEASDTGISSSWGQELRFDEMRTLDKKHWAKKGIAKITYEQEGRKKTFVLDDFKFHREPTDDILLLVESHLTDEQIINGHPEPISEEESEAVESGEASEH